MARKQAEVDEATCVTKLRDLIEQMAGLGFTMSQMSDWPPVEFTRPINRQVSVAVDFACRQPVDASSTHEFAASGSWLPKFGHVRVKVMLLAKGPKGDRILRDYAKVLSWNGSFIKKLPVLLSDVEAEGMRRCQVPICPHCGGMTREIKIKKGENEGKMFHGCLSFPNCRGRVMDWKPALSPDEGKLCPAVRCPRCNGSMVIRVVRRVMSKRYKQKFFGCAKFPACDGVRTPEEALGEALMGERNEEEDWTQDS